MSEQRLTLIRRIPGTRPSRAIFRCKCGTEKEIGVDPVKRGKTKSCGCLAREMALAKMEANSEAFSRGNPRHGQYGSGAWVSWHAMVQRCTNPNKGNYQYYGGRGITVCERWLKFDEFYADMGARPPGMTLERKDNEKGYSLENCVWATMKAQSNNRRARSYAA